MKKLLKITGIIAVVLVVLVVGVLAAAKILITPDRVREIVIPLAEKELNRPVAIGDIDIRIFSGIVLSDFEIGGKAVDEKFVSAESLVLRYRFWPLLRFSVEVDEVRLVSPDLRVERYADGTFNFSDLLERAENSEETVSNQQADQAETDIAGENGESDRAAIDLLINEIVISGGRLVFMDRMVDREYRLTDLNASISDFSPDSAFPFDISATFDNASIRLEGSVNPTEMGVFSRIRIRDFDVAAFMAYAPEDLPANLTGMKLDMDIRADASAETVDSQGRITLRNIDFVLDDMPEAPFKNARVEIDYEAGVDLAEDSVTISSAEADVNGIRLAASGSVQSFSDDPGLNITARLPMIAISDILAAVPRKLVEPVLEMQPTGRLGAQVHLRGAPDVPAELVEQGEITLEQMTVAISELKPEINGAIRLARDSAASDNLVVNLAGNPVHMNFTADNLMGDIIRIRHTVTAERLDIDRILDALGVEEDADAVPPPPEDEEADPAEEPGPFDLPLRVEGEIKVAEAVFRRMTVRHFDVAYLLEDNVLTIDPVHGDVAGGTLDGKAKLYLDRKPISYTADITVRETHLENMINALFPRAADTLFGIMSFQADLEGEGVTWHSIRDSMTSRADINLTDGRLSGTELSGGLASFLGSGRLEVLGFESLKGTAVMEKGRFRIDSNLDGEDIRMAPAGSIGLDGSIDMALDLRMAPDLVADIGAQKLVSGLARTDDGWRIVPVKVRGSLWSPRFDLDASAVREQLHERGRDELRRQIQDRGLDRLLPRQTDESDEKTEGEREGGQSLERKLEDSIRSLFN